MNAKDSLRLVPIRLWIYSIPLSCAWAIVAQGVSISLQSLFAESLPSVETYIDSAGGSQLGSNLRH